MTRALDLDDTPVIHARAEEAEVAPEPEFYTSDTIDNVDGILGGIDPDFLHGPTGRAVYECLRYLGHKVDDLRGENHRLRKRLSAVRSLSEFVHQNSQWASFSAARGSPNATPPDRLFLYIAERLDKIAGREFEPGRVVTKTICHRCGEVADEGCLMCGRAGADDPWCTVGGTRGSSER